MEYYIYSLQFQTPVHFGNTSDGGTLETVDLAFSADSLFSALCNESASSPAFLQQFISAVKEGRMRFSSLFPYVAGSGADGQWQYYLPRPIQMQEKSVATRSFTETKQEATKRKAMKKINYVRASLLESGKHLWETDAALDLPDFGQYVTAGKLNRRVEPGRPYFVSSYLFAPHAGLYFVAAFADASWLDSFEQLITQLGYSGIGGERTNGFGKFTLARKPLAVSDPACRDADIQALAEMLRTQKAATYMNISAVVPTPEELPVVAAGTYKLRKRGGFVSSPRLTNYTKRNSYYTLIEGSCFPSPLTGRMLEFSAPGVPHRIYRNGFGLFVGVGHDG